MVRHLFFFGPDQNFFKYIIFLSHFQSDQIFTKPSISGTFNG